MRQITLVAAVIAFGGAISAQVDKSNLTGIVRDGTGAAIPAVTIKLTSIGTGAVHSETSDASGFYRFTLIDRGVYRLEAGRISQEGWPGDFSRPASTDQRGPG